MKLQSEITNFKISLLDIKPALKNSTLGDLKNGSIDYSAPSIKLLSLTSLDLLTDHIMFLGIKIPEELEESQFLLLDQLDNISDFGNIINKKVLDKYYSQYTTNHLKSVQLKNVSKCQPYIYKIENNESLVIINRNESQFLISCIDFKSKNVSIFTHNNQGEPFNDIKCLIEKKLNLNLNLHRLVDDFKIQEKF